MYDVNTKRKKPCETVCHVHSICHGERLSIAFNVPTATIAHHKRRMRWQSQLPLLEHTQRLGPNTKTQMDGVMVEGDLKYTPVVIAKNVAQG